MPPLRYNQIQQRSLHNMYQKDERPLDQIILYRLRNLEIDIHSSKPVELCPAAGLGDWAIYHYPGDEQTNVDRLSKFLFLLRKFHDAVPLHEVITVHIEFKGNWSRAGTGGTFHCLPPPELDKLILFMMNRTNVFTPADLLTANPGTTSLFEAAGNVDVPGTPPTGAWPSIDELNGKFIFVVHRELDVYAPTESVAMTRACFLLDENLWSSDADILGNKHVLFYGEVEGTRCLDVAKRFPGLILRHETENDRAPYQTAQGRAANTVLTDNVTFYKPDTQFARTHNDARFPFGKRGLAGEKAWTDADVKDRREMATLHILSGYSNDVYDKFDSCAFAWTPDAPPGSANQDTWTVMVGTVHNDTVHEWGKAFLMARETLDPDSPYFAVGRGLEGKGLFFQYRSATGAGTATANLGKVTYTIRFPSGATTTNDEKDSVHFLRLDIRDMVGSQRCTAFGSIDGAIWHRIGTPIDIAGALPLRGIAASAHGSANPDGSAVEFAFQSLARNGNPMFRFPFNVSDIGDCTVAKLEDCSG